ncbi:RNA polymerase sigma factor [Geosporobacter ferrireducens]|uniref:RNA polymerase subunit sigma-70 n=1 Tax=Geosporobacter ferrireducens TaxID=1424294 RepID=A0A1D8GMZ8_9FIRM|nr:RNA polymerase sigma factor [Geosporobacter ferrireducens]AOT72326.1 hypothetical protein Gferi_23930 [Geosporobacter ferrireducens]MTI56419.1 RNA polymerase sigma factor [Geosporobacter ferrireducens]
MDLGRLFKDYNNYIYAYAYKLTKNKEKAEDLTQETFLKAYEKLSQLRSYDSMKYWLRSICFNIHLMTIRKQKNIKEMSYDELEQLHKDGDLITIDNSLPTPEDEVIVDEAIKDIQNGCFLTMVHRLSDNQRIVFSLVDMFGLTIEESAKVIDLSESAVKALLYRARLKLDKFFGENCSLVLVENPCNCQAWAEFSDHRNKLKTRVSNNRRNSLRRKRETMCFNNSEIRNKLRYLYAKMPDHKPSVEWYEEVLEVIENFYKN